MGAFLDVSVRPTCPRTHHYSPLPHVLLLCCCHRRRRRGCCCFCCLSAATQHAPLELRDGVSALDGPQQLTHFSSADLQYKPTHKRGNSASSSSTTTTTTSPAPKQTQQQASTPQEPSTAPLINRNGTSTWCLVSATTISPASPLTSKSSDFLNISHLIRPRLFSLFLLVACMGISHSFREPLSQSVSQSVSQQISESVSQCRRPSRQLSQQHAS